MNVRVLAHADWMVRLESHLPGTASRSEPGGPHDADILVVPFESRDAVLEGAPEGLNAGVVWVVPKSARQAELVRLEKATPASQFVFESDANAIAEAVRRLAGRLGIEGLGESQAERARDSMAALWEQFRDTMFQRLEILERAGAGILEDQLDDEIMAEAHRAAHKLHGSLGTFGIDHGSELASELEEMLEAAMESGEMEPGQRFRYSELVVGLRREIQNGRPTTEAPGERVAQGDRGAVVLIAESDRDRLEKLTAAAAARGWHPEGVTTAAAAQRSLESGRPVLAILDPAVGSSDELEPLLEALTSYRPPVPVIFQGRNRTLGERIQAVTLGARAFVDRQASADAVFSRAESLLSTEGPEGARILAVDDDPAVLRVLTLVLRGAGYTVRALTSPLEFWHTLEAVEPDLVLLDVDMPAVTGLQLCRAVRADARWSELPILFLTSRSGSDTVVAGFEAGGDDFVTKPVAGPELLARVETRLSRTLEAADEARDPETGIPGHAVGSASLRTQLALADRHNTVAAVVVVRIGSATSGSGPDVLARLAERLAAEIRPEDVVFRTDRTTLVVSRYGEDGTDARRWLERHLPEGSAEIEVGLAVFPEDGSSADIVGVAVGTLGASAVGAAAEEPEARVDADIVIVEDDEALGTLLSQTLDERGYNTHWIRDGAEAASMLTGESPALRASLIILDVGLPGMDGLTLLRQLARENVTKRTRVLMLTARSAESEVVKALELGAFDHVPKPFSVSELIHRVRRALADTGGS